MMLIRALHRPPTPPPATGPCYVIRNGRLVPVTRAERDRLVSAGYRAQDMPHEEALALAHRHRQDLTGGVSDAEALASLTPRDVAMANAVSRSVELAAQQQAADPAGDPQQARHTAAEEAAVVALAAYLATGAALRTASLPTQLVRQITTSLGIPEPAVRAAAHLAHSSGPPTRLGTGTAARKTAEMEPTLRARYLLAAATRIGENASSGAPVRTAARSEEPRQRQHRAAVEARAYAAVQADRVAAHHGPWLVWAAVMDARTDPACRALDGVVFAIGSPPGGVYPGAQHPNCRCKAVPA
jgi:SPP1 gp7 family putative phage head morphogenesis protein